MRARGKENVVVVVPPKSDYYSHRAEETREESGEEEQGAEGTQASTGISRRRQVIGILVRAPSLIAHEIRSFGDTHSQVLQLGIMIHSLVIGLTLAITSGADFGQYPFPSNANAN